MRYVTGKNRPITAICDGLLSGNEIAEGYIRFSQEETLRKWKSTLNFM
jgi:hypothetical protein